MVDGRTMTRYGSGRRRGWSITRWMTGQGLDAVGLDVSEPMLNEARRHDGVTYMSGDALALPLADRSRDLVALITTLEFVSDRHPDRSDLKRLARLARRRARGAREGGLGVPQG